MKNIEKIEYKEELLQEIKEQNSNFNLEEFFLNGSSKDGAVIIITPKQTICCYSQIDHCSVAEKICRCIYDDFSGWEFDGGMIGEEFFSWQQQLLELNCVCLQLGANGDSFVWVPDVISEYQLEQLENFKKQTYLINQKRVLQGKTIVRFYCKNDGDLDDFFQNKRYCLGNDFLDENDLSSTITRGAH